MDVRIGLADSVRDLDLELPDDTDVDALRSELEGSLDKGQGVFWLTDRKGGRVAVVANRVTYILFGASEKGRIGFGG